MDLWEWIYLLQFIAVMVIAVLKLLNIMEKGTIYNVKQVIIFSVGSLLLWGLGWSIFLVQVSTFTWLVPIMKIETFLFTLSLTIFTIIEGILLANISVEESDPHKRRNSKEAFGAIKKR